LKADARQKHFDALEFPQVHGGDVLMLLLGAEAKPVGGGGHIKQPGEARTASRQIPPGS
jgi:hypothetical protein